MTFEEALGYGSDRYEEPAVYEPPPPPANPPLTFRGVVGDRAIFEDTAGAGLLLAVGDRVGEVRVTRVDSRLVILEVGGYEFLYDVPVPPRR